MKHVEQLILHLVFSEAVKIHSINLVAPEPGNVYVYVCMFVGWKKVQGKDVFLSSPSTDCQCLGFWPLATTFLALLLLISSTIYLPTPTEAAPVTVKLYLNQTSFSFDDAENIEPTQTLELTEEDYAKDKVTLLKFVKFQRVNSLTVSESVSK